MVLGVAEVVGGGLVLRSPQGGGGVPRQPEGVRGGEVGAGGEAGAAGARLAAEAHRVSVVEETK